LINLPTTPTDGCVDPNKAGDPMEAGLGSSMPLSDKLSTDTYLTQGSTYYLGGIQSHHGIKE